MAVNDTPTDAVVVSAYSLEPLPGDGALLYLTFEVVGETGARTTLSFDQLQINEGRAAVQSVAGSVDVIDATSADVVAVSPADGATGEDIASSCRC